MAQRLTKAEMLCNNQREEIKEKCKVIEKLEYELDITKKAGSNVDYKREMMLLRDENSKQKQQIIDMEKFLSDYGLKWKGYEDSKKSNSLEIERLKQDLISITNPKYKYNLPKEIDINIILTRIDELNIIMRKEGCTEVYKDGSGFH